MEKHTMRSIYFLVSFVILAILAAIFVLSGNNPTPSSSDHQFNPPSAVPEDTSAEPAEVIAGEHISENAVTGKSMSHSQEDVSSLFESRCGECHPTALLKQYRKSRSEWQLTLVQMEAFGLELNDDEGELLLDYLSTIDNP